LQELNAYVPVQVLKEGLTEDSLSAFQVVVATNVSLEQQLWLNSITRKNGSKFLAADIRGLFGCVFYCLLPVTQLMQRKDTRLMTLEETS
jgi:ubiquitin-activating enzyme E1